MSQINESLSSSSSDLSLDESDTTGLDGLESSGVIDNTFNDISTEARGSNSQQKSKGDLYTQLCT